jgi:hypothetical protein
MEQREIRDHAARLAPDFVSLHPGYACYAHNAKRGILRIGYKLPRSLFDCGPVELAHLTSFEKRKLPCVVFVLRHTASESLRLILTPYGHAIVTLDLPCTKELTAVRCY